MVISIKKADKRNSGTEYGSGKIHKGRGDRWNNSLLLLVNRVENKQKRSAQVGQTGVMW